MVDDISYTYGFIIVFIKKLDLMKVDMTLFYELEEMFKKIKIRKSNRGSVGDDNYSQLLGFNRRRGYVPTEMYRKYPELYDLLQKISKEICPFPVENFMINKNFQTNAHYDTQNKGECFVFSVGDYDGGELVIEGVPHDVKYNPIIFDGKTKLHYNVPITRGTKWSVVGFNNR